MKHSRKSNKLRNEFDSVEDLGFLTDKQKRAERRRIKKEMTRVDRYDGRKSFRRDLDEFDDFE